MLGMLKWCNIPCACFHWHHQARSHGPQIPQDMQQLLFFHLDITSQPKRLHRHIVESVWQVLPELAAAAREALMELADGFPLKERLDISKNEKLQGCAGCCGLSPFPLMLGESILECCPVPGANVKGSGKPTRRHLMLGGC